MENKFFEYFKALLYLIIVRETLSDPSRCKIKSITNSGA